MSEMSTMEHEGAWIGGVEMDMTSDLSLQESCMAALRHMGVEVRALVDKTDELEAENAKLREERDEFKALSELKDTQFNNVLSSVEMIKAENAELRELVRGLHMAYVGVINKCESLDEALIWECSGNIGDDLMKSKAEYESDRHRFDVAMRELGIEVDE